VRKTCKLVSAMVFMLCVAPATSALAGDTLAGTVEPIVEEMLVMPFGPVRLVGRNLFDLCVAPSGLPGEYPPGDTDGRLWGAMTTIPPRFEYENFKYSNPGNSYNDGKPWPDIDGERFGGIPAGFVRRNEKFRWGAAIPYHKILVRSHITPAADTKSKIEADYDIIGLATFASYDLLSEAYEDDVTVTVGGALGWVYIGSEIETETVVSPSVPLGLGGATTESSSSEGRGQNVIFGGPFGSVRRTFSFCQVGFSALYMPSYTDRGDTWLSHEILFGPDVAVPIGKRVVPAISLLRDQVISDDRGPTRFPKSHYLLTFQVGVKITDAVGVIVGYRKTFGVSDYRGDMFFLGAAIVF